MDKDFEKKVKQKRIRTIAVVVVVLAAIVYLVAGTKVEKADYSKSLNKEIKKAQELYTANKENTGNDSGQYAPYTVLKFEKDIERAMIVAEDESSEYNTRKLAYETLQAQVKYFEKGTNEPVIDEGEVQTLIDGQTSKEVKTTIKEGKEAVYTVEGKKLKKAVTMNLMAREEGPYYDEINEMLAEKKLQGQVVSFYQDGSFGGKLKVKLPMYSETEGAGYVYRVNLEKNKLTFVSEADIDIENQTAEFVVKEGGDYVVLTKKIHKDKKDEPEKPAEEPVDTEEPENTEEPVDVETPADHGDSADNEEPEAPENQQEQDSEKDEDDKSDESVDIEDIDTPEDEDVTPPEDEEMITVSLNIRCDTLAADLSKLRDPSLEAYVPTDGVILSLPEVEVKKGATVYDVLDMVCRDKGIHMEAVYTPNYGADYIEGINYIYEFDAGEQSGWMYQVNGEFPNYGCSNFVLEDGDSIVWAYTCDMGKDLGKSF